MSARSVAVLRITKLDAARRQLVTAIRLYIAESDPVSIHTLTMAAYQILMDLSKKRGAAGMQMKEQLLEQLTEEGEVLFRKKFNEAENFFKHANRDSDATLDFAPGQTDMMLLDATMKYRELTGEVVPSFALYSIWFWVVVARDLELPEGAFKERTLKLRSDRSFSSRERFFREWTPAAIALPTERTE